MNFLASADEALLAAVHRLWRPLSPPTLQVLGAAVGMPADRVVDGLRRLALFGPSHRHIASPLLEAFGREEIADGATLLGILRAEVASTSVWGPRPLLDVLACLPRDIALKGLGGRDEFPTATVAFAEVGLSAPARELVAWVQRPRQGDGGESRGKLRLLTIFGHGRTFFVEHPGPLTPGWSAGWSGGRARGTGRFR